MNKRGQLQSIALARIEQDVKRVGKMVAVMPTSGDELLKVSVIVASLCIHHNLYVLHPFTVLQLAAHHGPAKSHNFDLEDDMKTRLAKSALLVPSELRTKGAVLDKARLTSLVDRVSKGLTDPRVEGRRASVVARRDLLFQRDKLERQLSCAMVELFKFKAGSIGLTPDDRKTRRTQYRTHQPSSGTLDLDETAGSESGMELSMTQDSSRSVDKPSTPAETPPLPVSEAERLVKLNRALMPYYSASDVENFLDMFNKIGTQHSTTSLILVLVIIHHAHIYMHIPIYIYR